MNNFKTTLLIVGILITATSCKKIKQRKKTTINLNILNTITQDGSLYSGIHYKLIKNTKKKFGNYNYNIKVEDVCEGNTNSKGQATIEFYRVMSYKKVKYTLFVDYLNAGFNIDAFSESEYINEVAQEKTNNITYYVGESINFLIHIKNTNCFDSNDKVVFDFSTSSIYLKKRTFSTFDIGTYNGCTNIVLSEYVAHEDYYPYTYTVTRDGISTTLKDTLIVTKAIEGDTINIFY